MLQPIPSLFFDNPDQGVESAYSGSKGRSSDVSAPFRYGQSSVTSEEEHRRQITEQGAPQQNYNEFPHQQRTVGSNVDERSVIPPGNHSLGDLTRGSSEARKQHANENNYLERELTVHHKHHLPTHQQQGQRSLLPSQQARDPMYDTVAGDAPLNKRAVHGHQETNRRMIPNTSTRPNQFEKPFAEQDYMGHPINPESFATGGGQEHVAGKAGSQIHKQAPCPMHQAGGPEKNHVHDNLKDHMHVTRAPWLEK